jgi:hypothetical protein
VSEVWESVNDSIGYPSRRSSTTQEPSPIYL